MKKASNSRVRALPAAIICFSIMTQLSACMTHKMRTDMTDRGPGNVWLKGDAFSPAVITVPVNTTVTWTNKDLWHHTVTSDEGIFDSGKLKSHKTFSHKFTRPGTYSYHCNIHKMMVAKVIVK
jgi:plastocyanin